MQGTYIADVQGDSIVIAVRSQYARAWLENRLLPLVQRTLTGLLGRPVGVQVISPGEGTGNAGADDSPG